MYVLKWILKRVQDDNRYIDARTTFDYLKSKNDFLGDPNVNLFRRILTACIDVIRPALGPSNVCIYAPDVTCGNYAKEQIAAQPLYKAMPRIFLRLLSCNPLTIFVWWVIRTIRQRCS